MGARKIKAHSTDLISEISEKVTSITGVQLGEQQRSMVNARLNRRMRDLGIPDIAGYSEYFDQNENTELNALISLLTTHHTFFFREFIQFELLKQQLPKICEQARSERRKTLKIWVSACSTGEEVYTIATFLKFHLKTIAPDIGFEVLASDVDPESVETAKKGVYKWKSVQRIPKTYLSGNWLRGTGRISDFAKVKDEIKSRCSFETINLLTIPASVKSQKFDVILCRNVFIYFEAQQIASIVEDYLSMLHKGGLILTGLSELLDERSLPIQHIGRSIYLHRDHALEPEEVPTPPVTRNLRVLCVDDSPTVHTILKKIINSDGFEIVGTAKDGVEAVEKAQSIEFDVMTLDIHMPNMNGLQYLQNHWSPEHPPVVVLSSVSANDAELAMGCLNAGATDYVEKPSLKNFKSCADEIRAKLSGAVQAKQDSPTEPNELRSSFSKALSIGSPSEKIRIIYGSIPQREKIKYILRSSAIPQPPNFLFMDCPENLRESVVKDLNESSNLSVTFSDEIPESTQENWVYLIPSFRLKELQLKYSSYKKEKIATLILGSGDESILEVMQSLDGYKVVEEISSGESDIYKKLKDLADRVSIYTSLSYEADRFLAEEE